jgi:quinol monooxygenase YgiN
MSELLGIARFKFFEGKRDEYLRLSDQAMDIVRTKDSGTLGYDLYLNGDQSECMVIERYRDSEAAIEHAANLGHLFPAVLATVTVVHGELLGEPSAELRANLAGSDLPVLFTPYRSWRPGPVTRPS